MKARTRKRLLLAHADTVISPAKVELRAAHDFRRQQQLRYSQEDGRKLRQKAIDFLPQALAHLKAVFPDAHVVLSASDLHKAPLVTDLDEPLSHSLLLDCQARIEQAAKDIGFRMHSGVSIGALFGTDLSAMQQRLMLTGSSIILVTDSMITALNRLSKLLALTAPISIEGDQYRISDDLAAYKQAFSADGSLQTLWESFFVDYAIDLSGPEVNPRITVPTKERPSLMAELFEAMISFVTAHEYAHHIASHQLGASASAADDNLEVGHREELEADMIGAHLCIVAGVGRNREPNFFSFANVGAVLVLRTLDMFRQARSILATGACSARAVNSTHPPINSRVNAIAVVTKHVIPVHQQNVVLQAQQMFGDIMQYVWECVTPRLISMHEKGLRPRSIAEEQWMP